METSQVQGHVAGVWAAQAPRETLLPMAWAAGPADEQFPGHVARRQ